MAKKPPAATVDAAPDEAVDVADDAAVEESPAPVVPEAPPALDRDAFAAKYGQSKSRTAYLRARLDGVTDEKSAGRFCDEFASSAYPRDVMMSELFDLLG